MLSKGPAGHEEFTDREGRRWEYRLLSAGAMELASLRAELKRLAAQGWEIDRAFGGLEQGPDAAAEADGELHVWLRRGLEPQAALEDAFAFIAAA